MLSNSNLLSRQFRQWRAFMKKQYSETPGTPNVADCSPTAITCEECNTSGVL